MAVRAADAGESTRRRARLIALAVVGPGVVVGLFVLGAAMSWVLVGGIVAFVIVATIPVLARGSLALTCAAVVAMLGVITFNVLLGLVVDKLPDDWVEPSYRLPIWSGLLLAVIVFAGAAYFYLRGTWLHSEPPEKRNSRVLAPGWRWYFALFFAVVLAVGVIIGVPPLVTWVKDRNVPKPAALPAERIGSPLDVVIVTDRPRRVAPAGVAGPAGSGVPPAGSGAVESDVRYSVGRAKGRHVVWTRTGIADESEASAALTAPVTADTAPPKLRSRADAVIVLLVDGTPQVIEDPAALADVDGSPGELARWQAIADEAQVAIGAKVPVVSLLQTTRPARLERWRGSGAVGDVASVQELGGPTITDAAERLGIAAANSRPYFDVAVTHRPILLFDGGEPVPRPLSIEQLFQDKLVRQCPDLESEGTCATDPILSPADLKSPGMHLVIGKKPGLRDLALRERTAWNAGETAVGPDPDQVLGYGSSMYVNPVAVDAEGDRQLLYLDYWWYLPDNPAGSGKRAFCGAGLVILGVTCFDHESDWEGATVVLERYADAQPWETLAVQYGQHEAVVRYAWPQLRAYWDADPKLEALLARLRDSADRPVAFVARGTHASYAHRCARDCKQVATGLEEGKHDGALPWVGDDTEVCERVGCLAPLPTASGGGGPASWNAFEGPWGRRHCLWTHYCDSGTPPPAPGRQDRYRDPARYDGTADVTDRHGGYKPRERS